MKYVELKNVTKETISITPIRGFRLAPGESKKVDPATAAHPAVRRLLPPQGSSLELVTQGNTAEVEPIAPANTQRNVSPAPVAQPVVAAPIPVAAPTAPVAVAETTTEILEADASTEMAGRTLREVFTAGPGVTDENVDSLLGAFASIDELAAASKDSLTTLGFSSSAAKKLLAWAKSNAA